jgi:hypothetical protein
MDISKLNKAQVLATLYNNSRPLGLGFLHSTPEPITTEQAQAFLDSGQTYFDYLNGRVMKIDLSNNELRTALYNRDNGMNAAENALKPLMVD